MAVAVLGVRRRSRCRTRTWTPAPTGSRTHLRAQTGAGAGVGGRGWCLPRGRRSWSPTILAVWKAGGAYLPIDPTYPGGADRVHARRFSGAAVLLSTEGILDDLPAGRVPTIAVDDPMIAVQPVTKPCGGRGRSRPGWRT